MADAQRFLGSSSAVVAIEEAWLERLERCRLYLYEVSHQTFERLDECAGYFVSRKPVVPVRVSEVEDLRAELKQRGAQLRVLPDLWTLRDAVVASSLQFSIIRMRNALPR